MTEDAASDPLLHIDVLTLFPEMFEGPFTTSIVARARRAGLVDIRLHDMREHAPGFHRAADDRPFGGGPGMVLKPQVVFDAVEAVPRSESARVVLTCPQGQRFDQALAREFAAAPQLVFLCGHYEGFDERIREHLVTDEVSLGDYVLTGGELAAMVITDAVVRLLPGAVGHEDSPREDSFWDGLLDHPHYTRPAVFRGWEVPEVLLSGDHARIARWRREQALRRTYERRPDLLASAPLSAEDRAFLAREFSWTG